MLLRSCQGTPSLQPIIVYILIPAVSFFQYVIVEPPRKAPL